MTHLMSCLSLRSAAFGLALMASAACVSAAELRSLVMGQSGAGADYAFGDAYHVAQVLRAGQSGPVEMLRDQSESRVRAALAELSGSPTVLIYYAGRLTGGGHQMRLADGTLGLSDVMRDLQASGTKQLIMLVEDCAGPDAGPTEAALATLDAVPGLAVYMAASAAGGAVCPARDARMSARLRDRAKTAQDSGMAVSLEQMLAGLWTLGKAPLLSLFAGSGEPAKPPMVSLVGQDVVTLAPVRAPAVSRVRTLQPTSSGRRVAGQQADTVEIFAAAARAPRVALPRAPGLPEPSIIVGVIEGNSDDAAVDIAYDDLSGRTRIRQQDPDRFAALVGGGVFDPPADQTARAIQSELSRMGCYNGALDGLWGSGSRGALQRYFNERPEVTAVSLEPVAGVFRQIIVAADVSCPAPRVTRTAAPRPTAAPAPAPVARPRPTPAPAPERKIQSGTSLGVFR